MMSTKMRNSVFSVLQTDTITLMVAYICQHKRTSPTSPDLPGKDHQHSPQRLLLLLLDEQCALGPNKRVCPSSRSRKWLTVQVVSTLFPTSEGVLPGAGTSLEKHTSAAPAGDSMMSMTDSSEPIVQPWLCRPPQKALFSACGWKG